MRTTIGIATFLAIGAGAVSVSALNLLGSDTLKDLTITLLTRSTLDCGGLGNTPAGTLAYEGTGSGNGQAAMIAGTQDVAPMSSRMSTAVCATAPGKAEGIVFALDAISIVARDTTAANAAGSCAGSKLGCNVDTPGKGLRFTFAGDAGAPPPALTSCTAAQLVDWRDVLRLIYFGYDASNLTTQNCASSCRTELANGYAKLFQSACTVGNSCTQLRHAFRRNDESGTTDVFVKALGVPAINQKDNFSPFCNSGTTGPALSPVSVSCAANADCGASGTCDTVRGFCTKILASSAQCPGNVADANGTNCNLERITAPQRNLANHNLAGCLTNTDCASGTCDIKTSECTCPSGQAQCAVNTTGGSIATCTAGLCVPITAPAASQPTPEPAHLVFANTATGYGPLNGSWVDMQDADPIRRACPVAGGQATEDVCNRDGRLGLVLPIWDATTTGSTTPNVPAVTTTDAFPAPACDTGFFTCQAAVSYTKDGSGNSVFDICADGTNPNDPTGPNACPPSFCAVPYTLVGSTQDRRCFSSRSNLPIGLASPNDGRTYNDAVWQQLPSGQFVLARYPRSTGQSSKNLYGTVGQVAMLGAWYKLHYLAPTISGSGACQKASATDQIGCFAQASWCSIGYAGNSAVNGATTSINVNNTTAEDNTCTQNLINLPSPTDPKTYRIARRLFLNSVKGFESIDPALNADTPDQANEYKLAQCYGLNDDGAGPHGSAAGIATATPPTGFGFIPLPGTPFCDDVALNVCGQTAACPNNTGAIPSASIAF